MMDASTRGADHSTDTSNRLNPLESPPQALKDLFKAWRPHSDPTGRQKCWDVEMATVKNEWSIMDLKTQETSLEDFSQGERFPWDDAKDPSVPHTHGKLYTIPEIPGRSNYSAFHRYSRPVLYTSFACSALTVPRFDGDT